MPEFVVHACRALRVCCSIGQCLLLDWFPSQETSTNWSLPAYWQIEKYVMCCPCLCNRVVGNCVQYTFCHWQVCSCAGHVCLAKWMRTVCTFCHWNCIDVLAMFVWQNGLEICIHLAIEIMLVISCAGHVCLTEWMRTVNTFCLSTCSFVVKILSVGPILNLKGLTKTLYIWRFSAYYLKSSKHAVHFTRFSVL